MTIATVFTRVRRSPLTHPISLVYGAAVFVAIGISDAWFSLGVGLVLLSSVSLLIYMVSLRREVTVVQRLVEDQRVELLAKNDVLLRRIDILVGYLVLAGIELPPGEASAPRRDRP